MDNSYVFMNPVDLKTTQTAMISQTSEALGLLQKTIKLKFNMDKAVTWDSENSQLLVRNKSSELSIQIENCKMNYLTVNDIIHLNEDAQSLFEEEGIYGVAGLKDRGIVETAVNNIGKNSVIFGEDQFPTISQKAAHLWFKLARYQAFNNGNKRTGLLVALNFLENNNYHVQYEELKLDKNYFYVVSKKIATGEWDEQKIREFILRVCILKLRG
ncbi:type II toxin-antitoxin system death-on-curing family toxin [Ligilactobacillus hohenheimensis]|uniref:type II toxin-antitoxin system death-on-curing family toxin n=1 Tax=Ligilactobacillus hohenheimensis TaxID=2991832 RepID=UPI0024B8805C|nr:Fic family protein [Ligilactobacillus hohenheimensis]